MDIGINYITNRENNTYDSLYKVLVKNNFINTLKFPGKYCSFNEMDNYFNFIKETEVKIDLHGLPGIIPAIHSINFMKNINWQEISSRIPKISRISTHMGLENKDRLENYTLNEMKNNFKKNIDNLKQRFKNKLGYDIQVGIENIPGGFDFDPITLSPEFIDKVWEEADFGVFDITHAKLSALDLNISFKEYINKIKNKDKVKIIHISGNIDNTNTYPQKKDKHVLIHTEEIKDIIETIKKFKNVDSVISEYAYKTKYTYEKELLIEAITLNVLINTMNIEKVKDTLEYLEKELQEDGRNAQKIINTLEK